MAWNGLSYTAAAELAGRRRSGAAIGFQQTVLSVMGVAVPVAFAATVAATSWRAAFALAALGPLAGWAALRPLRERPSSGADVARCRRRAARGKGEAVRLYADCARAPPLGARSRRRRAASCSSLLAWLAVDRPRRGRPAGGARRGRESAGGAVQGGFESAADRVDGTPLVGDDIGDALRDGGRGHGRRTSRRSASAARSAAHDLADILGILFFGLPATLVFALWLPRRVERGAARSTPPRGRSATPEDAERSRLIAMRAAFSLPYPVLARYTPDPFGDLAAERYDRSVAAAYDEVGLRPPARQRRTVSAAPEREQPDAEHALPADRDLSAPKSPKRSIRTAAASWPAMRIATVAVVPMRGPA